MEEKALFSTPKYSLFLDFKSKKKQTGDSLQDKVKTAYPISY